MACAWHVCTQVVREFPTLHVALRGQVVNLVGLRLLDHAHQAGRIGHVAMVQEEPAIRRLRVLIEMIDTLGVELRTAALDAVHFVALFEQELREVRPILFRWGEWM